MTTVFLIGNGFDINLGLKTKYSDFYNYYTAIKTNNDSIKKLKEHLQKEQENGRYEYWSDLELALGNYTKELNSKEEMFTVYDDINDHFREYIKEVNESINFKDIKSQKLIKDLSIPEMYLLPRFQTAIREYTKSRQNLTNQTHIITFNYTHTLELLIKEELPVIGKNYYRYDNKIMSISHIHGDINDPLLGVNDETQIHNPILKEDEDILDYIIKPRLNNTAATNRENICLTNILNADVIYMYGLSIGETDRMWWETIGQAIKNNRKLVYFAYCNEGEYIDTRHKAPIIRKYIKKFLEQTTLTEAEKENAKNNIYIQPNCKIFKSIV